LDVFALQSGIFPQYVVFRVAMRQQPDNELHGKPSAANDGLSGHHRWIHFDSFEQVLVVHGSSPLASIRDAHSRSSSLRSRRFTTLPVPPLGRDSRKITRRGTL